MHLGIGAIFSIGRSILGVTMDSRGRLQSRSRLHSCYLHRAYKSFLLCKGLHSLHLCTYVLSSIDQISSLCCSDTDSILTCRHGEVSQSFYLGPMRQARRLLIDTITVDP